MRNTINHIQGKSMDNILPMCIVAYIIGQLVGRSEFDEEPEYKISAKNDREMIEKWNERRRKCGMEEHEILD
jgi:hypothetical protein